MTAELLTEVYMPVLCQHPFWCAITDLDEKLGIKVVSECVTEYFFSGGRHLFERGAKAAGMYMVRSGMFEYMCGPETAELKYGNWASEAAIWVDDWVHRGTMVCKKPGGVLELTAPKVCELLIRTLESCKVGRFIKAYAGLFVRNDCKGSPKALKCSDLWGDHESLHRISCCASQMCKTVLPDEAESPERKHCKLEDARIAL